MTIRLQQDVNMVICTCWLQTQGTSAVRWFWAEALWDRALIHQMVIRLQQDSKMASCSWGCWINIFKVYKRNIELVSCHWIPLLILFLASSPPRDCSICDWSIGSAKQSKDKPNGRAKMRRVLLQTEFRHWFADDRVTIGKRLCVLEVVLMNDVQ